MDGGFTSSDPAVVACGVYTTGEPYVGNSVQVEIQRQPGGVKEPRYLDLVSSLIGGEVIPDARPA